MRCPTCGGETLPHTRLCFECGAEAPAKPAAGGLIVVSGVPSTDHGRLASLLTAIVAEPRAVVEAVIQEREHFEVTGLLPDEHWERLGAWLAAGGARQQRQESRFEVGRELTLGWRWSRLGRVKVAATLLIGATGAWLAAPYVPLAAGLVAAVLAARAVRLLPVALTLAPPARGLALEILDPALAADAARTRAALSTPALVAAIEAALRQLVEVLALLRASALHLTLDEVRGVDHRLEQLMRQAFRVAVSVDRLSRPASSDARPQLERDAAVAAVQEQLLGHLEALARRLDGLRGHLIDLHRADARRELLAGPLRQVWELEARLESAVALAEL